MGLTAPRAVSGTSSSRGHVDVDVDVRLAELAAAAAPLRIRIPPPSKEEGDIYDELARLSRRIGLEDELDAARNKHMALCFNSSESEWVVGDAQLYVAELELELAKVMGDDKKEIALEKRVVRLRNRQMELDEKVIKWTQDVLIDLRAPPKKSWFDQIFAARA